MRKEYRILEIEKGAEFQDFGNALIVKVVELDKYGQYQDIIKNGDYDQYEEMSKYHHWLLFKPTDTRLDWLVKIYHRYITNYDIWLDLDEDFDLINYVFEDPTTGETINIEAYKVKMVSTELDIVEAKQRGLYPLN